MDWQVDILQRPENSPEGTAYEVVPVVDGVAKLYPGPFVIEVRMPEPMTVHLNVLGDDRNFKRIVPGLSTGSVPPADRHCFSPGAGLAEPGYHGFQLIENGTPRVLPYRPDDLVLSDIGHHYLYFLSPQEHRWSAITWSPDGPLFYRDVKWITNPIERCQPFNGHDLYLTFLVKCAGGDIIQPEELQKIQVQF